MKLVQSLIASPIGRVIAPANIMVRIIHKNVRIAALAFAAAVCSTAPANAGWFFDSYDGGGRVLDYYEQVRSASYSRRAMPIEGYCASACTMKLGARNACVSPDATLMFHSASSYGMNSWAGNTILMSMYPRAIRSWVRRHRALDSQSFVAMSGREAIALGIRPCSATGGRENRSISRSRG